MSFDFMTDIVAIELRFGQQVAAEALKNIFRTHFAAEVATPPLVPDYFSITENQILAGRKGRKNRYMKCEATNARTLV